MAGRGKRPTEERKYKSSWDVAKVEAGDKMLAWIAGPHIRVKVHKASKLKACLREHAGRSDCPGCAKGLDTQWYAYTPVYREPDKHEFICAVTVSQGGVMDKPHHHHAVMSVREDATGMLKGLQCGPWINATTT